MLDPISTDKPDLLSQLACVIETMSEMAALRILAELMYKATPEQMTDDGNCPYTFFNWRDYDKPFWCDGVMMDNLDCSKTPNDQNCFILWAKSEAIKRSREEK